MLDTTYPSSLIQKIWQIYTLKHLRQMFVYLVYVTIFLAQRLPCCCFTRNQKGINYFTCESLNELQIHS